MPRQLRHVIEALEGLYDVALRSGWTRYQARHPELEVVAIRVRRALVNARRYDGASELEYELFREVRL